MGMRRDGLAVAAVALYAGSRGYSFLPDQLGEQLPAGIQFLTTAVGKPVVSLVYAALWLACAVMALGGFARSRLAPAWLLPTMAISLLSCLLYGFSYIQARVTHTDLYERAWATALGYLATAMLIAAFVQLSMPVRAAAHAQADQTAQPPSDPRRHEQGGTGR